MSATRKHSFAVMFVLGALVFSLVSGLAADAPSPSPNPSTTNQYLSSLSLGELLEVPFDTVSTASRRSQKIWEAPASVSIVTRDEIKTFGYRTLADALRSTAGFYTTYDRSYTYIGLRGFSRPGDYNSRVLLLIDGSRANDNVYDSALIGQESLVDVDNIERLEVIRGPSSSLYGSSAFFGTINVITRRGGSLNGIETSVEGGAFNTYKARLAAGYQLASGLEFFVAGSYFDTEGQTRLYYPEYDAPEFNNGVAEHLDYERAWHFTGNASYQGVTLSSGFNSRTRGVPTASFNAYFNDPRAQVTDLAGYVDLKYEHEFAHDVQLATRIGYHRYDYHEIYPTDVAGPGDPPVVILNKDDVRGEWWGAEATVSRRFFDRLTLTGGVEVRDNFRQDQANYDEVSPATIYVDSRASDVVAGVYGQADWAVLTNLILSAGLRYDYYSTFGGTRNPRLGLIYQPWQTTTLKLLYGRAFRSPNAYEFYYTGVGQEANPNLRPETIRTYELALEQSLNAAVKFTASGFYYDIKDLIALNSNAGILSFQNLDRVNTFGGELGVEGRWENGWFGRLSYTAQRAEDGDGVELSNSPRHLAKLHVRIPLMKDRLFLGTEIQYIGSAKTVQPGRVGDAWVANVTLLSQELVKNLEISASIYNLFDRRYGNTGFEEHQQRILYQDGRTFRLKLTYKF